MAYCTIHGAENIPGCPECEGEPADIRAREEIERDRNAQIASGGLQPRAAAPSRPKTASKPKTARKPAAKRPSRAKPKAADKTLPVAVPKNTEEVGANAAAEEKAALDAAE